jgi:iron complex outermembrane receptor protein
MQPMTTPHPFRPRSASCLSVLFSLCCLIWLAALPLAAAETTKIFDVPAGEAVETLKQAAQQAGKEIMFPAETVRGVQTATVKGEFAPLAAFNRMLADTPLMVVQDEKTGAYAVSRVSDPNGPRAARVENRDRPESSGKIEDGVVKLGTYEVFGSKSINADLPRTRDDVQPYVVFSREQLSSSPATNLEDFFRARLPMNQASPGTQASMNNGTLSTIDLRGLGANQTLILLDGRRLPSVPTGVNGQASQPDINGIPLRMIERIEVLPSTASGIYGGGATGGVINIITRKDYSGIEAAFTYQNAFDTDVAMRRVDLNGTFNLEEGKTMLTFNYSYSETNRLLVQDRDFARRSRELFIRNNPAGVTSGNPPPQGYLPNIRNSTGGNLVLKNGTPLNSPITSVPIGYAGPSSDGGAALVANAGRYNLDFPDSRFGLRGATNSVPEVESFGLSLRRSFGKHVEAYLDGARTKNVGLSTANGSNPTSTTLAANAPNNPFTTAVSVSFPELAPDAPYMTTSQTDRFAAGAVVRLPAEWMVGADYIYSRSIYENVVPMSQLGDPDGAGPGISFATALSSGTLDVLRDLYRNPLNYAPYLMTEAFGRRRPQLIASEWTVRGSGPLLNLQAGPLTLSASAQRRDESIPAFVYAEAVPFNPMPFYRWYPKVSSRAWAYNAELRVPIFGKESGIPLVRGFEFQAAVRRDDSSLLTRANNATITLADPAGPFPSVDYVTRDFQATKATVGFKHTITEDLALRASVGTGFLAPTLSQLMAASSSLRLTTNISDPRRGGIPTPTAFTLTLGGNPNLRPEKSESVSAGVVVTPRFPSGLRLSIDYTRIEKTDEIGTLSFVSMIDQEDALPGRVVRAPLTPADQALGYTGGLITLVNTSSANLSRKIVEAWDVQVDYTWKTASFGEFEAYAVATYQPRLDSQLVSGSAWIDNIGFNFGTLKFRGNGGLNWRRGPWGAGWNAQYYHSHFVYSPTAALASRAATVLGQGSDTIPSQIYHDLTITYRWGSGLAGWQQFLAESQVTIALQNVFNTSPPIIANLNPLSGTNAFSNHGDPRLRRYTISLQKKF